MAEIPPILRKARNSENCTRAASRRATTSNSRRNTRFRLPWTRPIDESSRKKERYDDGLVEIGVELHDSVHAFLVLRDFPLEHQTGSLQLRVELSVRRKNGRKYLGEDGNHVVVHHTHAVHQRQLHPVRFIHDPGHVPLVIDLLVGWKALQHLRVTNREERVTFETIVRISALRLAEISVFSISRTFIFIETTLNSYSYLSVMAKQMFIYFRTTVNPINR